VKKPKPPQLDQVCKDLNEISHLANSLLWLGDKLRTDGRAVDEAVLLKHVALDIGSMIDDVIGYLKREDGTA
jgi:hypothetical protein